ncbi:MAG: MerR family transcriptional regulator [Armatimonadota bacterium]
MRSLEEWTKYLEEQEHGLDKPAPRQAEPAPVREVPRPQPELRQQAKPAPKPEEEPLLLVPEPAPKARVRRRLPSVEQEVAQSSYRTFRETREELLQRLLDPQISLEEAARILNVCPTTVRRYTNKGVLPHVRTPGNQRRFRLSDVLGFMENRPQP